MRPLALLFALVLALASPAAAQTLTAALPESLIVGQTVRVKVAAHDVLGRPARNARVILACNDTALVWPSLDRLTGRAVGSTRCRAAWDRVDGARQEIVASVRVVASTPVPPPDTVPLPPPNPPAETHVGAAELPRVEVDVAWPVATGVIRVSAGQSLQGAVDVARCGDEIVLDAGATFTGTLTLRRKDCEGWIVIRSGGQLPPPGTRVRPSDAAQLARLVATRATELVIRTEPGASGWRLVGLEVTADPAATLGYTLVALGSSSREEQATREAQPHHLVLDRMYIHGTSTLDFQRCVALNSATTAIVDSWISECHGKGKDSQAIGGWNGTGPYKIVNNYLEGAGENVMFGGADPKIPNALPEDIEIRRNHFYKPAAWKGVWTVKNLLELKIGRRVLVEGNVLENNWADGQTGFALNLKSVNQSGGAPWSETADVVIRDNRILGATQGASLHQAPEQYPAVPMSRVAIVDNEWGLTGGLTGRWIQLAAVDDVLVEGNVAAPLHSVLSLTVSGAERFVMRGNVVGPTTYGIAGNGAGYGTQGLDTRAPGWILTGNTLVGGLRNPPPDNEYPAALAPLPRLARVAAATAGVVVPP